MWYSLFKIERDYIKELWKAIENRKQYTDLSPSACAYTEAPAEGIFSIYSRVTTGRERLSIGNAVSLTRVALHGPPPATPEAAILAKAAMSNYKSQYGERYCTLGWKPGATSTTMKRIQNTGDSFVILFLICLLLFFNVLRKKPMAISEKTHGHFKFGYLRKK